MSWRPGSNRATPWARSPAGSSPSRTTSTPRASARRLARAFTPSGSPNDDAEVVRRLRRAGAVVIGKTNLHELAFGATTQNPHYGSCRNPWDPKTHSRRLERRLRRGGGRRHVRRGSRHRHRRLGQDSGRADRHRRTAADGRSNFESRRRAGRPAARYGGADGAHRGRGRAPLRGDRGLRPRRRAQRRPAGGELVQRTAAGHRRPADRHSWRQASSTASTPTSAQAAQSAAKTFADLGAQLRTVDLDEAYDLHTRLRLLVPTHVAARNRERLAKAPETFGPDVRERMSPGLQTTGADYADWLRLIERWRMRVRGLFEAVDVILTPTVGSPAPNSVGRRRHDRDDRPTHPPDLRVVLRRGARAVGPLRVRQGEPFRSACSWSDPNGRKPVCLRSARPIRRQPTFTSAVRRSLVEGLHDALQRRRGWALLLKLPAASFLRPLTGQIIGTLGL